MKTENLARGLKLLALECSQDKEFQAKLWDLRRELISKRILKAQAENILDFRSVFTSDIEEALKMLATEFKDAHVNGLVELYATYADVSRFAAQHCINHILGVGK